MSAASTFNPLPYIKKLRAVGVPEEQTEVHAATLSEIIETIEDKFATKQDLQLVKQELKQEFKQDMQLLETNLRCEIDIKSAEVKSEVKSDIIKWTLAITSAQTGLIMAFIGFIKFLH